MVSPRLVSSGQYYEVLGAMPRHSRVTSDDLPDRGSHRGSEYPPDQAGANLLAESHQPGGRMVNGKMPLYLTLLAGVLCVVALWILQPYTVRSPWDVYTKPAHRFLEAAL